MIFLVINYYFVFLFLFLYIYKYHLIDIPFNFLVPLIACQIVTDVELVKFPFMTGLWHNSEKQENMVIYLLQLLKAMECYVLDYIGKEN